MKILHPVTTGVHPSYAIDKSLKPIIQPTSTFLVYTSYNKLSRMCPSLNPHQCSMIFLTLEIGQKYPLDYCDSMKAKFWTRCRLCSISCLERFSVPIGPHR